MCVKLDESDRAEPSVVDAMIAFTNQKQSDAKRWFGNGSLAAHPRADCCWAPRGSHQGQGNSRLG